MSLAPLASVRNLELAWRRINTGVNHQHKRFFRDVYYAYEAGLQDNLRLLRDRLHGAWQATAPTRIYVPKASGLVRPLTLLALEDQIVLQAVANLVARRISRRRRPVERRFVFSNCIQKDPGSIFFFVDWRETYNAFKDRLKEHLHAGYQWVAHFDLAAFYDTISHQRLINLVAPRGGDQGFWTRVAEWFQTWSADTNRHSVDHGIPQGPIASDFLADAFLLPLDEGMRSMGIRYLRYVDDIRVFADSELHVQKAAVQLEIACRRLGLIPQSSKFAIKRVASLKEALGSLPSIAESGRGAAGMPRMSAAQAEKLLRPALKGRPLRIVDKTRAKYVLHRAEGSPKLLRWTLQLSPRQPEHVDTFTAFWTNYDRSRKIERELGNQLVAGSPYHYVQGELWHVIARLASRATLKRLLPSAEKDSRDRSATLALKWGVIAFLMASERAGLVRATGRIRRLPALLQALVVPLLPDHEFQPGGIVQKLLTNPAYEPGIALAEPLARRGLSLGGLRLQAQDLAPQVQNVFAGLGLIPRPNHPVDQVGDILTRRYEIVNWSKWQTLFDAEYTHALQILLHGDYLYLPGRSEWTSSQNSFNDALVRALLPQLGRCGLLAPVRMVDVNGDLVKFGVLVGVGQPFDRAFPKIAGPLREFNGRRNLLPGSHPYATRGGTRNRYLTVSERSHHTASLQSAYREIIRVLDPHV